MKLGLMTAAFPNSSLEEIAEWAAQNGYDALEIACWPAADPSKRRRYGGVCHIDVATLDAERAASILEMVRGHGLEISGLGYYPNPMDADAVVRAEVHDHLKRVIDAAALLDVGIVGTFLGRDTTKTVAQNVAIIAEVWRPLVDYAGQLGQKIAIENCPMIFRYEDPSGGTNLATSPAMWRAMFEAIPDKHFGLNFDPSHLLWEFIDYERAVYEFADRIFHVQAKDMEVRREGLYEHGVMSQGVGWQIPRLPGLGEVRWNRFLSALYAIGFDGTVAVEHEDAAFEGSTELVARGFVLARNVLRPLIV
jgi:sugar phosphate isomerase/epimerase